MPAYKTLGRPKCIQAPNKSEKTKSSKVGVKQGLAGDNQLSVAAFKASSSG